MDEDISTRLSDAIILSNRQYSLLIGEMKGKYAPELYKLHLEKLAQMMALSFDILDELGKEFPHLNPEGTLNDH
ncbi:MAG: hypothetical protein ACRBBR_07490 [Cellvibrionaceae bacterium]